VCLTRRNEHSMYTLIIGLKAADTSDPPGYCPPACQEGLVVQEVDNDRVQQSQAYTPSVPPRAGGGIT